MPVTYWAPYAWLATAVARDVQFTVEDGRFTAVEPNRARTGTILDGLVLPGLANAHSHAFHRALRGRAAGRDFWAWREGMYTVADRLDPDSYHALARATFAEMALAGITCVGEFHYLHHGPGGVAYDNPNEMGLRLIAAAAEAGIRITLLDTLYLSSTVDGAPLEGPQRRFGDETLDGWAERVDLLQASGHALIGAAAHSVRAVPRDSLASFGYATDGVPTHIHLSEQPAENEQCLAAYGRTPARVLDDHGLLGPDVTVVHATHLTEEDCALIGGSSTSVCACPTTERDLADGIGPFRALTDEGSPLCLGSDSHAVIDLFEEARAVELNERLATGERGRFQTGHLITAATWFGHESLGWREAGVITVGARADLVCVALDSARTVGFDDPVSTALYAASAADVREVIVDGRHIVQGGRHQLVDVSAELDRSIRAVWAS